MSIDSIVDRYLNESSVKRYSRNMALTADGIIGYRDHIKLNYGIATMYYYTKNDTYKYFIRNVEKSKEDFIGQDASTVLRSWSELKPNYMSYLKSKPKDPSRPVDMFDRFVDYTK